MKGRTTGPEKRWLAEPNEAGFAVSNQTGTLYVIATPIGNLEDLGARARRVMAEAHIVAAEDTRHSRKLLEHYGITRALRSCHEFNEREAAAELGAALCAGRDVAILTDAGTPSISDPGFRIVQHAHELGVRVAPIPGPCAAIAALSVSGLPTDRFVFEGFLPPRAAARRRRLHALRDETRTVILYEAPHRVPALLHDCVAEFGGERRAVLARELTKRYETVHGGTLDALLLWLDAQPQQLAGEFVVLIAGTGTDDAPASHAIAAPQDMLKVLLRHLPLSQAVQAAVELSGRRKAELYRLALQIRDAESP
jgi:16S rRNA (cytidine1402-2'-O)-methyltransferase